MTTLRIEYWCASCDTKVWKVQTTPIAAQRECEICKEDSMQVNYIEEAESDGQ